MTKDPTGPGRRAVVHAIGATMALTGLGLLIGFGAGLGQARASGPAPAVHFDNIDGGSHDLAAWRGRPVLIVNTASRCGFTPQYDGLQALWERYRDRGLIVLAVPSDDFRQELATAAEVKEFCEVNFGLDLPMADITPVLGREAHPFYRWMADNQGWAPSWNFNKVLLGPEGAVLGTWGSSTRPTSAPITRAVERALGIG